MILLISRPIEMESFRNNEHEANTLLQAPQTYVPTVQPAPPVDRVTYAQIIRPARIELPPVTDEQFDFRLQSPQQTGNSVYASALTSGRSSVSSGYIDLTQNLARPQGPQVRNKNVRPTSPETSF